MLYAVLFEDMPGTGDIRAREMARHLTFLEENSACILAAGPLVDPAVGTVSSGLWLVEADTAAEVESLYKADPFWPTGLRKSVVVREWRQVFAEGKRRL